MKLNFSIEKDIDKCKELWEEFSPHEMLWDEWEVMLSLHNKKFHEAHFIIITKEEEIRGIVPLQFNKKDQDYELFGGVLPENRKLWIKTEDFMEVNENLPNFSYLFDMNGTYIETLMKEIPESQKLFTLSDYNYFLTPEEIQYDFSNHLQKWDKKKRKNFLNDLKGLALQEPEVKWSEDNLSEAFIELNQRRFNEESDYKNDHSKEEAKRLTQTLKEKGWLQTQSISIKGKIEAVGISAFQQDTFQIIYAASNPDIKNLGKRLHLENINRANSLRAKKITFMVGQKSWKDQWHFDKEACYSLQKKIVSQKETPIKK